MRPDPLHTSCGPHTSPEVSGSPEVYLSPWLRLEVESRCKTPTTTTKHRGLLPQGDSGTTTQWNHREQKWQAESDSRQFFLNSWVFDLMAQWGFYLRRTSLLPPSFLEAAATPEPLGLLHPHLWVPVLRNILALSTIWNLGMRLRLGRVEGKVSAEGHHVKSRCLLVIHLFSLVKCLFGHCFLKSQEREIINFPWG